MRASDVLEIDGSRYSGSGTIVRQQKLSASWPEARSREENVVTVMGAGFLAKAATAAQEPLTGDRPRGPRP